MSAGKGLVCLRPALPDRVARDRLEILTALINAPSFDPIYRPDIIKVPRGHPVYRWHCVVEGCERVRCGHIDLCAAHHEEWVRARDGGATRARYLAGATPLASTGWECDDPCQICLTRPGMRYSNLRLCRRHHHLWRQAGGSGATPDGMELERWVSEQEPLCGYGDCQVVVCGSLAESPLGLCSWHARRYRRDGWPGAAELPPQWWHTHERSGRPVPVSYADQPAFRVWCAGALPAARPGQIHLRGLRPLLRAEIQWTLFANTQQDRPSRWDLSWVQKLASLARTRDAGSLIDLDVNDVHRCHTAIVKSMRQQLRLVYFTPEQTRDAGFLETDHFGVRFPNRVSHFDLTAVSQRWLRDLLWDHLADLLGSPRCPRSAAPVETLRRAATELSAFLELQGPGGGHDPTLLRAEHAQQFTADQRYRDRNGLASLVMKKLDGTPSIVTATTRCLVTNGARKLLRAALDSGAATRLGREFIVALPTAGYVAGRATPRRPFPDEVAQALAEEANLVLLAGSDPEDLGMRDIWETIVCTGRRVTEVLRVRWDCLGRYGGLAMFWHDQTKVGNYDAAIRIPERLHQILTDRQHKTLDRFHARHRRTPTGTERAAMALFPSPVRNPDGRTALTYHWFWLRFRAWVDGLDLGHYVAHQARHTLATNLLRQGASLTHIRRYLGHVSERMAEHYVHLSQSDLENVLQQVWVAGPGTAHPGQLLSGEAAGSLTREQAMVIAVDLARRSTPAEGGFCTFQPVVDGGACPWNLDCHNCDKFVLSGADLLYWRRKREHWRLLAEAAPDDTTADYLHRYFEPTARAIDGLEKALAGLGLLDEALALDLRKPQDYFHRVWSTAFRATDLAQAGQEQHSEDGGEDTPVDEQPCA